MVHRLLIILVALVGPMFGAVNRTFAAEAPGYSAQIRPLLVKYCTGCHNNDDLEGELSLESFVAMQKGGENGPAMLAGNADSSRMIRMLTGKLDPAMPPEDEPQPKSEEIALFTAWINGGALGPKGQEPDRRHLLVPQLSPSRAKAPITAVAASGDGKLLAVARFKTVEILSAADHKVLHVLAGHPGKINGLQFTADHSELIVASGITGLYGEARVWDVASGSVIKKFAGHRDTMYVAAVSTDGETLATGSYDRKIILWDYESGKQLHVLSGHNDAVYDLAFSPDGKHIASASGDTTVKIWSVATGERLDTRNEPLKEVYTVAFSPDGQYFVAGGADNYIRMWRLVSKTKQRINPPVHARYGHEGGITRLRYTADGKQLVTVALDNTAKVWDAISLTQLAVFKDQSDTIEALAVDTVGRQAVVGRMDGSLSFLGLPDTTTKPLTTTSESPHEVTAAADAQVHSTTEAEPNDEPQQATPLTLPAVATGVIDHSEGGQNVDTDLYRFTAKAGQVWILEINAARNKSPLDSKIEILDADFQPVPRVMLQAVRDSYFTFRGKNSDQTGDFRLHKWEEMSLNQYLYTNGEVVRFYHYPRGPDSGFNVYPNSGLRYGYFGTTPISHALGEVCYVVEPHAPEETIVPNGLPVFQIDYQNDDDSRRKLGKDSRLRFVAPRDGDYFVRVRDVRGFQGSDYKYTLSVRQPKPDYKVTVGGQNPTVHAGSGRRFDLTLDRIDDFAGPVSFHIEGLPPGFSVAGPLSVEAGQLRARGTIVADLAAPTPTEENSNKSVITATAMIGDKSVTRKVGTFGEIKLGDKPKLFVTIAPFGDTATSGDMSVITIPAGTTIKCKLRVKRNGHEGVIGFGKEEAANNLPHGVYVGNTGLNGVLLRAGQNERTVFITAEPWVQTTERPIFFEADAAEKPTSPPLMLRVVGSTP